MTGSERQIRREVERYARRKKIDLSDEQIDRIIARAEKAVNKAKLMQEIIEGRFENEATRATGGKPWKRLKPATIKQRIRGGYGEGPILQRTVMLKERAKAAVAGTFSLSEKVEWDVASVGVDYAAYHQEGGGSLPRRPFFDSPSKAELSDAIDAARAAAMREVRKLA